MEIKDIIKTSETINKLIEHESFCNQNFILHTCTMNVFQRMLFENKQKTKKEQKQDLDVFFDILRCAHGIMHFLNEHKEVPESVRKQRTDESHPIQLIIFNTAYKAMESADDQPINT